MMVRKPDEFLIRQVSVVEKYQFTVPYVVFNMLDISYPSDIWFGVDPETNRIFFCKEKPDEDEKYHAVKARVTAGKQTVIKAKVRKVVEVVPGDKFWLKLDPKTRRIYMDREK